jgi:hypothetical protein
VDIDDNSTQAVMHTFTWTRIDDDTNSSAGVIRGPTVGGFNVTVRGADFGPGPAHTVQAVAGTPTYCVFARSSEVTGTPICNGVEDFPGEGEVTVVPVYNHTTIVFTMPAGTSA